MHQNLEPRFPSPQLPTPRAMPDGQNKLAFYAIRPKDPNGGVFTTWPSAMTAGYIQKQGYGNAAKFDNENDAMAFAASPALEQVPRNHVVRRLPAVARLIIFSWLMTFFFVGMYVAASQFAKWWGCGQNTMHTMSDVVCLGLSKMMTAAQEHFQSAIVIIFTQIVGSFTYFAAYMTGLFLDE